jgi:hypothetical protein
MLSGIYRMLTYVVTCYGLVQQNNCFVLIS